ncbi:MAG: hypothetical protein P1U77_26525, partial [Rubripirellula sp.]|nr:hypothetical protein [Rubripirellula sp.]
MTASEDGDGQDGDRQVKMGTGTFLPPNECWHFVTNANPLFYIPSPTIDRFVESKARRESKATFNAALFASLQTDALVES